MLADEPLEGRVALQGNPEALGNAEHGQVVVGGPHATRGEDMVEAIRELSHRASDALDVIGEGHDAVQVDAEGAQLRCEPGRVLVAVLSAEDLVADDENGCCGHGAA